jgi:hypothetical protein
MTIAAAYLTTEGVVLGADSTTTVISPKGGVVQLLNYGQKIFEVGEHSRFAVCTWGSGRIGNVSHRTLVARVVNRIDMAQAKVSEVLEVFSQMVAAEYGNGKTTGIVGYLLGGCDPDTHTPHCYWAAIEPGCQIEWKPMEVGTAQFFGCPEFFSRVFHGFDTKLPGRLLAELKKGGLGIKDEQLEQVFNRAFQSAVAPLAAVGFPDLPIREAIDFIHTYLHITIKGFKFRVGPPICGGPIEIAFISTDRPFRWVCHKGFERAIYEQEM